MSIMYQGYYKSCVICLEGLMSEYLELFVCFGGFLYKHDIPLVSSV